MTGLEKIIGKIMEEAKTDAENILAEAREKAADVTASYETQAEKLRRELLEGAAAEAKQTAERVNSGIQMENRNFHLRAEAALVDEAFLTAAEKIRALPPEEYLKFLGKLLLSVVREQARADRESLLLYGEEGRVEPECYELLLNESDRKLYGEKLVSSVKAALSDGEYHAIAEKLVLSDETAAIDGGLVLRYGDIACNCSLQNLITEVRSRCEGEVHEILFRP